jgi:hypothetical protein
MELELEVDSRGTHGVHLCVAIGRAVAVAEVTIPYPDRSRMPVTALFIHLSCPISLGISNF